MKVFNVDGDWTEDGYAHQHYCRNVAEWADASPLTHVRSGAPPFLLSVA